MYNKKYTCKNIIFWLYLHTYNFQTRTLNMYGYTYILISILLECTDNLITRDMG